MTIALIILGLTVVLIITAACGLLACLPTPEHWHGAMPHHRDCLCPECEPCEMSYHHRDCRCATCQPRPTAS